MKTVSRSITTARSAWVLTFATIFVILFSLGQVASASDVNTYDNFSSGDTTKWIEGGTTSFLEVKTSSLNLPSSNYVLHAEGWGTDAYPRAKLFTTRTFSGNFGAGLTFFNFDHEGSYTPQGTPNPNPSINLIIGNWGVDGNATSSYFLIARAVNYQGQNIIGWREYDANGTLVPYTGGSWICQDQNASGGGLELNYNPAKGELELGYFASTDTSTWDNLDPVVKWNITNVHFADDPRLLVSFAPGTDGSHTSVDVGGLYYAEMDSRPVPLPSGLLLLAPGLAGIAAIRRRFTK
jgi:hypothetical protein